MRKILPVIRAFALSALLIYPGILHAKPRQRIRSAANEGSAESPADTRPKGVGGQNSRGKRNGGGGSGGSGVKQGGGSGSAIDCSLAENADKPKCKKPQAFKKPEDMTPEELEEYCKKGKNKNKQVCKDAAKAEGNASADGAQAGGADASDAAAAMPEAPAGQVQDQDMQPYPAAQQLNQVQAPPAQVIQPAPQYQYQQPAQAIQPVQYQMPAQPMQPYAATSAADYMNMSLAQLQQAKVNLNRELEDTKLRVAQELKIIDALLGGGGGNGGGSRGGNQNYGANQNQGGQNYGGGQGQNRGGQNQGGGGRGGQNHGGGGIGDWVVFKEYTTGTGSDVLPKGTYKITISGSGGAPSQIYDFNHNGSQHSSNGENAEYIEDIVMLDKQTSYRYEVARAVEKTNTYKKFSNWNECSDPGKNGSASVLTISGQNRIEAKGGSGGIKRCTDYQTRLMDRSNEQIAPPNSTVNQYGAEGGICTPRVEYGRQMLECSDAKGGYIKIYKAGKS